METTKPTTEMTEAEFAAHAERIKADAAAKLQAALAKPLHKTARRIAEDVLATLKA